MTSLGSNILAYWRSLAPRWQRLLALLLLAPGLVLAIIFWRTDVKDPLTISALLLDRTLQVATVLLLPLSVLAIIFAPWRIARPAAAVGGVVVAGLAGSAGLAALRPPVDTRATLLAIGSFLCGCALALTVLGPSSLATKWRWSLIAPLTILPLVQFWHATSFVPARLVSSVSVTPTATVQDESTKDRRGIVEVELRNSGEIGALVLAAEVTTCFRSNNKDLNYNIDVLYEDTACQTDEILDETSVVDAKSVWAYHQTFSAPKDRPLVQLVVQVWYARSDRLRVQTDVPVAEEQKQSCGRGHSITYRLEDEAKYKGVVQRDRFLTYEGTGENGARYFWLTTAGEQLCAESKYDLGQYLGASMIRLNQEDWLSTDTNASTKSKSD